MSHKSRIAFVTVGQSPRDDILPEMLARLGGEVEVTEVGVLDGLDDTRIADLAPAEGERRLCTRLRDGREVVTSKAKTGDRLNGILADLSRQGFDLIVLICTGYFENVHCDGLFIESQRLVDNYVAALAHGGRKVGVMVPLAEQTRENKDHTQYERTRITHASPYSGDRLREAGRELADVDLIVMHCMGYSEDMRRTVAEAAGKPVVLARRVIAAGIDQLI
ncbi:MAG: AroM family protein [Hyphomicrobiales bacterium]|nr:AroM family protein [Hyphomicrobiales bacterium]